MKYLDLKMRPAEIIEVMRQRVHTWQMEVPDDIAVAPLSGGFDSRLLCSMVPEPKRLATFTYGISQNQEESFEVQIAANVARLNGNEWAHIPLEYYHRFIHQWWSLYGISCHLHGMYHF